MRDQKVTAQVVGTLKKSLGKLTEVSEVAIHGSLVQGTQLTSVSDGDLLLLLDANTESRIRVLNEIKDFVKHTAPRVANLLNTVNPKPVSPTILTELEFKWGIVKTKKDDNFFDTCTYNSLKPVGSNFWAKENLWRYRHEGWRAAPGLVKKIVDYVKDVQKARAEYCTDSELQNMESFDLKAICRAWYMVFGENADPGNDGDFHKGFSLILKNIPMGSSLRLSGGALYNTAVLIECNPVNEQIMLMWEYFLDAALKKLDELIPPIDEIFKDYNERVQQGWLEQWGYARDANGLYLDKSGNQLVEDGTPIKDWKQHHKRIVQEGLNTGSVEYAKLFAEAPNKFGPCEIEHPRENTNK